MSNPERANTRRAHCECCGSYLGRDGGLGHICTACCWEQEGDLTYTTDYAYANDATLDEWRLRIGANKDLRRRVRRRQRRRK